MVKTRKHISQFIQNMEQVPGIVLSVQSDAIKALILFHLQGQSEQWVMTGEVKESGRGFGITLDNGSGTRAEYVHSRRLWTFYQNNRTFQLVQNVDYSPQNLYNVIDKAVALSNIYRHQ